jgi:hypothetical protein
MHTVTILRSMRVLCSTEYPEWKRPLSGVHSIFMMGKSAQAGGGGGGGGSRLPPSRTSCG